MELVITILPYSCSTMYFWAALEQRKLPLRCTSSTLSQSSSLILNERLSRNSPALLTRMSIRPKRWAISSKAFSTCCALDTSQAIAIASAPAASTASTVSWQESADRSRSATFAPSCASRMASAAPMPRAAPVTTAVRPSSLNSPPHSVRNTSVYTHQGVVFVTCHLIVYELNVCVQNRYIHLWMHNLPARGRILCSSGRFACLRDHMAGCGGRPPVGGASQVSLRPYVDTAVYVDRLACDVVTVFYEVADGPGDLFGLAEAAEGHLFEKFLLGLLRDAGYHIGLYEPGAEGVDGDPVPGQFLGGRLGEAEQPGLGRRVVGLAYVAGLSDEGAHVDDLASALVRHVWQRRVDRVEGAVEVYLDDLVPVVDGELLERTVYVDPRVVDQDVYPVELLYRLIYEVLGLLRVRDVGLNRDCLAAALRDLCYQLFGRLFAPGVVDDDFGPPFRQLLRYGPAQTPARAGHDDYRFFQGAHATLLLPLVCETEFIDCTRQKQTRYHKHVNSSTRASGHRFHA